MASAASEALAHWHLSSTSVRPKRPSSVNLALTDPKSVLWYVPSRDLSIAVVTNDSEANPPTSPS